VTRDRLVGLLLFLPVPLVLWLFTRQPLGTLTSLGTGVVLVATHRLYARPFARRRAERRCLWCGGAVGDGPSLRVREPSGPTSWRACGEDHARRAGGVLAWAAAHARPLKVGILGTLAAFLLGSLAVAVGGAGALRPDDAVAFFRLGIALTVLPLGFASSAPRSAQDEPKAPFPVHIQALIGTAWVLWLFRLVGLWWLGAASLHVARRLGLA
jgi:hypothetical protein